MPVGVLETLSEDEVDRDALRLAEMEDDRLTEKDMLGDIVLVVEGETDGDNVSLGLPVSGSAPTLPASRRS